MAFAVTDGSDPISSSQSRRLEIGFSQFYPNGAATNFLFLFLFLFLFFYILIFWVISKMKGGILATEMGARVGYCSELGESQYRVLPIFIQHCAHWNFTSSIPLDAKEDML
ncbi:hypothetical protein M433DRAFT_517587 [Acidomyces richmondensis BFW]|nr:MAG: hypothetical protein FE78DRAFT_331667 [Acidomyces sp. 'richmondensis']KYG50132.1 hypothetical protein M433DRAFT_517587 [Acidomyces richmondensis BFW]